MIICWNYFGEGSSENVVEELKRLQNDDGGFGNVLESDLRLPIHPLWALPLDFVPSPEKELFKVNNNKIDENR